MTHRLASLFAVLLTLALCVGLSCQQPAEAAVDSETVTVLGVPAVVFTVDADSASVAAVDSGAESSKRAAVASCEVNGQVVFLLARYQVDATGTVFVDVLLDETLAAMDTRLGAMDLSSAVPAHPAPTEDASDEAARLSAGGS